MRADRTEGEQFTGEINITGLILRHIGYVKAAGVLLPQGTGVCLLPEHVAIGVEMPNDQILRTVDRLRNGEVADHQKGTILQLETSIAVGRFIGREDETIERFCPDN